MLIPYPLEPPPPLPPLDDPWETPETPLVTGRRVWTGDDRVDFNEGPSLEGLAVLGPLELRDRRVVALEEPLFVWEVEADGPVQLMAEVAFGAERVRYERTEDGSRLWLGSEDPTDELLISCYGGTVDARDDGERLLLHATGQGRVRLVVVGAWSEADRDRTLRALMRKGVAGVVAQQVRHADMLARLGVQVMTPGGEGDQAIEDAKRELDALLEEQRDGHRVLVDPCAHGAALLALGLREPVRDTLRAPLDDAGRRRLFARYAQWAGADDFVRRHWARLLEAVRAADRGYRTFQLEDDRATHVLGAAELIPLAEALGDPAAVEFLESVGAGVEWEGVLEAAGEEGHPTELDRWCLVPDALEGTLLIAPELPEGWPEMAVARVRVGDSSLDVRMRRRPAGVALTVRLTRGPQLVVTLAPVLPYTATGVLLGAEQLPGPTVRVTLRDEVEALWIR